MRVKGISTVKVNMQSLHRGFAPPATNLLHVGIHLSAESIRQVSFYTLLSGF